MSITRRLPMDSRLDETARKWKRRRDIPIAILAWIGVIAVILWGAMHIARTIVLLILAAMLAFALAPGIRFLERYMPRPLAILIMCLVALTGLGVFFYFVADTTVRQFVALSHYVNYLLTPQQGHRIPLEQFLSSLGISSSQIASARSTVISRLEGSINSALPLITRIIDSLLDVVVVAVLTIYFLIDGDRIARWCRRNLPSSIQPDFTLDTIQRVVGGYIRGQLLLSVLIGLLVGIGMTLFGVPYAILLGVIAFIFEFVPILGTLVSGVICVLIALTHGWLIALGVLIYFIVIHVIEGDVIGPRIVGKAIGLHPIVSIAALIAGAELFGVLGALLASPIAGLAQAFIIAFWQHWRDSHPEQFARVTEETQEEINEDITAP